eukprot:scaffold1777_cov182-Alexandrium_tamarense.AAC.2
MLVLNENRKRQGRTQRDSFPSARTEMKKRFRVDSFLVWNAPKESERVLQSFNLSETQSRFEDR